MNDPLRIDLAQPAAAAARLRVEARDRRRLARLPAVPPALAADG